MAGLAAVIAGAETFVIWPVLTIVQCGASLGTPMPRNRPWSRPDRNMTVSSRPRVSIFRARSKILTGCYGFQHALRTFRWCVISSNLHRAGRRLALRGPPRERKS